MDRKDQLSIGKFPPKPEKPLESDCCGSGCSVCVFDIYQRDLEAWEKECLQLRLTGSLTHDQETLCAAISKADFKKFELISIVSHTKNTAIYRFRLPAVETSLNLEAGQHLILRSWLDGRYITRSYTPIDFELGYFDVLIKIYPNGLISSCISQWLVGDLIEWRGPFGNLNYQPNQYKHIVMLAAGTGIAPMLQVIKTIIDNENDETFMKLFYSCKTAADILLKQRLDEYQKFWNFQVVFFLTKLMEEEDTKYLKYGDDVVYQRIDEDYLSRNVSLMSTRILICGTWSFDKDMMNYCMKIGIREKDIFRF